MGSSGSIGSRRSPLGFTLIELLIVLSILSLATFLTASLINAQSPSLSLNLAAEQLVSDLKEGRLSARETNRRIAVSVFDDGYRMAGTTIDRRLAAGVTIRVESDAGKISFAPHFANLGGQFVLTKGRHRATILIHPFTGRIERLE